MEYPASIIPKHKQYDVPDVLAIRVAIPQENVTLHITIMLNVVTGTWTTYQKTSFRPMTKRMAQTIDLGTVIETKAWHLI